jgi:hypothetical protein
MASLTEKLSELARNPKAQQALTKAREAAAKPENKAKIERLRSRLTGGRPAR